MINKNKLLPFLPFVRKLIFYEKHCVNELKMAELNTKCIKTAGLIIVGDEILNGKVMDVNTHIACKKLYELGIKVDKILVIGDDIDVISNQVRKFSNRYNYVITSGGIGPTHDDVTFAAIAKAFDEPLFYHPDLMQIISNFYKLPEKIEAGKKMALIPKSSKLTYGVDKNTGLKTKYPNVSCKNVYVFPGIPELFRRLFLSVADIQFGNSDVKFYSKELYLNKGEVDIVNQLNEIVQAQPNVAFGSYPELFHSYYNVKITMESLNNEEVNSACNKLEKTFKNYLVPYDPSPLDNAQEKLNTFMEKNTSTPKFFETYKNLKDSLQRDLNFYLWFDGHIQAVVLLHLIYVILKDPSKIEVLYHEDKSISKDIQEFVMESVDRYKFNFHTIIDLKPESFQQFVQNKKLIMASCTMENYINTEKIKCTVENPLVKWTDKDVWNFIRSLSLPYCKLYDKK